MLGFEFDHVLTDEQLYDETLRDGVKRFQFDYKHRVTDGRVGPGTRERLVWCWRKLSISVVVVNKKLRRLSSVGTVAAVFHDVKCLLRDYHNR